MIFSSLASNDLRAMSFIFTDLTNRCRWPVCSIGAEHKLVLLNQSFCGALQALLIGLLGLQNIHHLVIYFSYPLIHFDHC